MSHILYRALPIVALGMMSAGCSIPAHAAATPTKLVKNGDKWQLIRDGKPYVVKGAGGDGSKEMLKAVGANSFRTWGADNLEKKLDEAQKLGLSVTIGIWLGHKEHGFSYDDPKAVADQFENAKAAILRYKDHPAVLAWGIGNEMEGYEGKTNPNMWKAVQEIAAFAHKVDPNHPTMTVTAEIGGDRVKSIHEYCPDIDIVGINTYGGSQSIGERYAKEGGTKPYMLTEFGPPGTWEMGKNGWGAVPELTSTAKSDFYGKTWEKTVATQPLSVGGYAFTWGNKQEASATWFGMLLHDGTRLGAVDAMQKEWTGKYPENRVPEITSLKVEGVDKTKPDGIIKASLATLDHEKDPLKVNWVLQYDPLTESIGGETQATPPTFPEAIQASTDKDITLKMPNYGGAYRLFAFVYDGKGGGAVANVPLYVEGGEKSPPLPARKVSFPFEVLGEGDDKPYVSSGYMGNTGAIKMTETTVNPHSGTSATKVEYTANDNWGGVVWQSPANDWGSAPGGYNLTGAKKLTFWARGEKGGEEVTFSFGLIGPDKPYHDTGKGETGKVTLGKEWKQYSINLEGLDLSRIKTGFCWVVGAHGQPITFYLDDIKYENTGGGFITTSTNAPAKADTGNGAGAAAPAAAGLGIKKATLPFIMNGESGDAAPFIPAGYMGNTGAIKMSESDENPKVGKSSTKVEYTANDNWGGVVWQSPANDWGNAPGGWNLTGAKTLSFWARGAKGGEEVTFSFGLIGADKPYHDSAKGETGKVKLTTEWKQYKIDLTGKDLSSVKTGFCWVVGGQGSPLTFFIDDLKYE